MGVTMGRIFLVFLCGLFCCFTFEVSSKEYVYNDFDKNPHLTKEMRKKIKPYLLPHKHPAREFLDSLCLHGRVFLNPTTFEMAGFITLHTKPRSFIRVARHPLMPGYLFKVYLDSEKRKKNEKEGWEWLVARCKGARQVRHAIKKQKSKFFQAPNKWLYPLPPESSPINSDEYIRQPVILVVDDMDLIPEDENLHFWANHVQPHHLYELYAIISIARGSSYRPDNIWLSHNGKFSFIDTEYPKKKMDYWAIKPYLSPKMQVFWTNLVRRKGFHKFKGK